MYSLPKNTISNAMILVLFIFGGCSQRLGTATLDNLNTNPSDPRAQRIADDVMIANGGQEAWDDLTYVKWNFFGSRLHVWNKKTNDYYIKGLKDDFLIRGNLKTGTTSLIQNDKQVTNQDSLTKYGEKAVKMWNNDAYWLLMPFKLKDPGTTLKYLNTSTDLAGNDAYRLELTFTDVGDTPDNKYIIYVDTKTNLVTQWDFYVDRDDEKPRFQIPWTAYEKYDGVYLASDRGDKYKLEQIATGDTLAHYFNSNHR